MSAPFIFKGDDWRYRVSCTLNAARREAGLPEEAALFKVSVMIKGFELNDEQFERLSAVKWPLP